MKKNYWLIAGVLLSLTLGACTHEMEPLAESGISTAATKSDASPSLVIQAELPSNSIANAVYKVIVKSSCGMFGGDDPSVTVIPQSAITKNGKKVTFSAALLPGDVTVPAGTEILYQFQVSTNSTNKYTAYRITDNAVTYNAGQSYTMSLNCTNINKSAGVDDNGTAAHPYLVGDRRQMQAMAGLLAAGSTKYFRLVDDIDAYVIEWTPLNPSPYTKKVNIDGNGKTISNLKAPLLDDLNGSVSDLNLEGSVVTGESYLGALAKTLKTATGTVLRVNVSDASVTATGGFAAGLIGSVEKSCTISNCSVENTTVTGTDHYAGGLVASMKGGTVTRCHTTGSVTITTSKRHVGGIVGIVEPGFETEISYCWSSCNVSGWGFVGGIAGTIQNDHNVTVNRCFASGNVSAGNIAGAGGLIGQINTSKATVKNCVAWNGSVTPATYALGNYSSGAVVGRAHPNCVLTDNYRRRSMSLTAYWVPGKNYDHPDVNGISAPLVRIGTDKVEANAAPTTLTGFDSDHGRWAYHGKHTSSSAVAVPDDAFGWTGSFGSNDAQYETVQLREGVQWTHIHDYWEGKLRNINIVRTTLSSQNHLRMYYNYSDEGYLYLDEKCNYLGALAGTNGPMACCHFARVDGVVKRRAISKENEPWLVNGALTIDGNDVDIVRVADNFAASELPNSTVGCAGPVLVWDGVIQTASAEWLAMDTEAWLTSEHPRTAIGITEDGNTVIQVTVDGRWTKSGWPLEQTAIGMSTDLLGKLMKSLGCYRAVNLDGGGGTAMWVRGHGNSRNIVNHVSENRWNWDGTILRTTGNALYITY